MSRVFLILGAVAVLIALLMTYGGDSASVTPPPSMDERVERKALLDGLDLSTGGNGYALILHPMATGAGLRVVTDPDALHAAQGKAFYTDDPGEQMEVLLLSVLFLSPPGMPPDSQFASLVQNKEIVEHFRCYPAFCNQTYEADPPHARDLAGLLEASIPVERITKRFRNPDNARAAHFRAIKDPEIVQIDPPSLPRPNIALYSHRVILSLPAVLLDTDEAGQEPVPPFDEGEYAARFTAAFTHAYPDTEAYRLGEMRFATSYPPLYGWPVVSDRLDGYLRDEADNLRGITRIMVKEPTISVELTPSMTADLQGPNPFAAMPEFAREPDSLSERLDALAEEVLGAPCPDCFKIELPVATVDDILVRAVDPIDYTLSYLQKVPQ